MLALEVIQPSAETTTSTCDCAYGSCRFSVPRVRFYLHVWRQAVVSGESFASILRAETRNSRLIDPWIRGSRANRDAEDIGLSLELAGRAGLTLAPWNAERVAAHLCSRSGEDC